MVERATAAVRVANEKIRSLKLELFERNRKIEELTREVAAAGVEVERTRDRADKLEEIFTQVWNECTTIFPAKDALCWIEVYARLCTSLPAVLRAGRIM